MKKTALFAIFTLGKRLFGQEVKECLKSPDSVLESQDQRKIVQKRLKWLRI